MSWAPLLVSSGASHASLLNIMLGRHALSSGVHPQHAHAPCSAALKQAVAGLLGIDNFRWRSTLPAGKARKRAVWAATAQYAAIHFSVECILHCKLHASCFQRLQRAGASVVVRAMVNGNVLADRLLHSPVSCSIVSNLAVIHIFHSWLVRLLSSQIGEPGRLPITNLYVQP